MNRLFLASVALALLQAPITAWALKIQTLDLKRHYRFYLGGDKNFVGDPYDWSGVSRTVDVGKWGAMISPSYFISANHFHPATNETFRFFYSNNTNGSYEERTVLSGQKILGAAGANSDLWLGKLSAPVSSSVAKYPLLRLPNTLSDYTGKTLHVFGRPTDNNQATNSQTRLHMGLSRVGSVQADAGGSYYSWGYGSYFGGDTAQFAEGGDSGGSTFIVFNGVPTVLGTHYYATLSSFAPDYITQLNAAMSASGEQVTVITLATTPALPQNLTVAFTGGSGVQLTWADIADTETGYALERRTVSGAFVPLQTLPAEAESCTDGSASTSVSYEYRLRAFNASATSEWVTVFLGRQLHAIPYAESFESFAPEALLPGFEGWYAADAGAAQVDTNAVTLARLQAYAEPVGYPLRAAEHAQVAVVEGAVSNRLAAQAGTAVWCDMMVELTPNGGQMPPVAPDLQCALTLDSTGRLTVWHRDLLSGTNRWSALAWQTPLTSQWARVTLHMDYATVDAAHSARYFQLFIDGAGQSHALAYTANDGTGTLGGTWFALAGEAAPSRLSSLFFDGTGALDDLTVDTARPLIGTGPQGTPEWWLADNGLTNGLSLAESELADGDGDGFANWREFAAGTDPAAAASLLRFVDLPEAANGRLGLVVQTVPGRRYTLESSTDLAAGAWAAAAFAVTPEGAPAVQTVTAAAETLTLYAETAGPFRFYRVQVLP